MSLRKAMLVGFVVLNITIVGYIVRRTNSRSSQNGLHVEVDRQPSPQQARVDEFITIAGELKTFDDAAIRLDNDESDAIQMTLLDAGSASADAMPELMFNSVICDRRVARIYELLREMPPETARVSCNKLFEEKLLGLRKEWDKFSAIFKESPNPVICNDLRLRGHSVAAAVFLSAFFCPPETAGGRCDEWENTIRSAMAECGFDPDQYLERHHVPITNVFPQQLFVLNVYELIVTQNGCDSVHDTAQNILLPIVSESVFARWDSQPTIGGTSIQDELVRVPFFEGWQGIRPGEDRSNAVLHAKRVMEDCIVKSAK